MSLSLVERLAAAKAAKDMGALVDVIPYAKWLGLSGKIEDGALITTMTFAPHLVGNPALPALHGGTLGALMESAAVFELLYRAESIVLPKTITITVDYLRSAATVDTYALGTITRHGRRVANVSVVAWQEDRAKPVATAVAHFLVMAEQQGA
ncbi:MAG TPA: PaaI family thioesterase [Kofleriaceae bacterium]|nr:PaaI family thioesterase [Kofleriaceae bacterium]